METNEQIIDEASEWLVTLRHEATDAATQERFMAWLRRSPEHVRAYLSLVDLWTDLPAVDSQRALDAQALIERARADANVFELNKKPSSQRTRPLGRHALAASLALLLIAAGAAAWMLRDPTYVTDIGEQRFLKLADGSTVELNSRSRIRVRYSKMARTVDLLEGQALFRVFQDPLRPFMVDSGSAQVLAIGTQFDVYRKQSGTVVTVVEGKVAILTPSPLVGEGRGEGLSLAAGEQLTISADKPSRPTQANVAAATSWTRGQLMFKSTPLSAVVEEFNRYNARQLVLVEGAEDFPITAVFSTTDPGALIEFLRDQPDVAVHPGADEILIRAK